MRCAFCYYLKDKQPILTPATKQLFPGSMPAKSLVFSIILPTIVAASVMLRGESALAWQIINHTEIPEGAASLAGGDGELWCGYEADRDSLILVISPETGEVQREIVAPEAQCQGLTHDGELFWYLGVGTLYQLDSDGQVVGQSLAPYEEMRGLTATDDGFWTVAVLGGRSYLALFGRDGEEITRFRSTVELPTDIAWDGTYLWLTDPVDELIHQVDPGLESDVDIFPAPVTAPRGIAWLVEALFLADAGFDDAGDLLFEIDPEAADAPRILPGARYHSFGVVTIDRPAQWYLTVYNIGSEELHLTDVSLLQNDSYFSLGDFPPGGIIIDPGQFNLIQVWFAPDRYGVGDDVVRITSNDSLETTVDVTVSAVGIYSFGLLGVDPPVVDCGVVRADPWRDGSSLTRLHLFNEGIQDITVDSLLLQIEEIFQLERPQLPYLLEATDSLTLDLWFVPHIGIHYLDTLIIWVSNSPNVITYVPLMGRGDDSVYSAGTELWTFHLEDGDHDYGAALPWEDISGDDIREVMVVGPAGNIYCLNGFASGEADVIWQNEFPDVGYRPDQVLPAGGLIPGGDLDGDGLHEILVGSGGDDPSVYAISSLDGSVVWHWRARQMELAGEAVFLTGREDVGGDGIPDPALMLSDSAAGESHFARLNGVTGETIWSSSTAGTKGFCEAADWDQNGIRELATINSEGNLLVINGATGRGISTISFELLGGLAWVESAADIDDDGFTDLLLSFNSGGLMAYSLAQEIELWRVDVGFQQPGDFYGPIIARCQSGLLIAAATAEGWLLSIAGGEGDVGWSRRVESAPTALAFVADLNGDQNDELALGYASGLVECRNSSDGELIWEVGGGEPEFGAIVNLCRFDDVDLGGTGDILALDSDGTVRCLSSMGDVSGIGAGLQRPPPAAALMSLSPNPFNSGTVLSFHLPEPGQVSILMSDVVGRQIQRWNLGYITAGFHRRMLDMRNLGGLPDGVYLLRLTSPGGENVQRAVLLK